MGVVSSSRSDRVLLSIVYMFEPACRPMFKPPSLPGTSLVPLQHMHAVYARNSEGGMTRLETLIELKFPNSSFSSLSAIPFNIETWILIRIEVDPPIGLLETSLCRSCMLRMLRQSVDCQGFGFDRFIQYLCICMYIYIYIYIHMHTSMSMYVYILCVCSMCIQYMHIICMYVYIYIYIERERYIHMPMCVFIHICIFMY